MKAIYNNLEIRFWDTVTEVMDKSPFVQKSIRVIYHIKNNEDFLRTGKISTMLSLIGLFFGFAVFTVSILVK